MLETQFLPAAAAAAESLQSCLALCDPIDGSPPGSAAPGILQARTLKWVAIAFSNAYLLLILNTHSFHLVISDGCSSSHHHIHFAAGKKKKRLFFKKQSGSFKCQFHFHTTGQNLVTWPQLPAKDSERCHYSGYTCVPPKIRGSVIIEERRRDWWVAAIGKKGSKKVS